MIRQFNKKETAIESVAYHSEGESSLIPRYISSLSTRHLHLFHSSHLYAHVRAPLILPRSSYSYSDILLSTILEPLSSLGSDLPNLAKLYKLT
jgi:hypothetical protein